MEKWINKFAGHEKLNHVLSEVPDLCHEEIFDMALNRNGPVLTLKINITGALNFKPEKWKACNALILHLGFYALSDVSVSGWDVNNLIENIEIGGSPGKINFTVKHSTGFIQGIASALRVIDFQAYTDG